MVDRFASHFTVFEMKLFEHRKGVFQFVLWKVYSFLSMVYAITCSTDPLFKILDIEFTGPFLPA